MKIIVNKTRNKLALLKAKAEKSAYVKDWRFYFRRFYKDSVNYFEGGLSLSNPEKFGLIEITEKPSFINGWYADNYQDIIYHPIVFVCRSKEAGKLWVFCGYHDKEADYYIFETPYLESYAIGDNYYYNFQGLDNFDYHKAWRYAEVFTEREAEKSREFYAKDSAKQDILSEKEKIHELNKSALELIKEIKGKQYAAPVCEAIKARLQDILNDRKSAFDIIKARQDDFWTSVDY